MRYYPTLVATRSLNLKVTIERSLHFTRPCLHSLLHLGPEIFPVGNGSHGSQFPMERVVGDLGKCVRQPSNMFNTLYTDYHQEGPAKRVKNH